MLWPPDGDGWTRLGALPAIPHIVTAMSTIMTDFSTNSLLCNAGSSIVLAPLYFGIVCLSGAEFPVMNLNDSAEEGIPVANWEGTLGLSTNNRNIRIVCFFQKTQHQQLGCDKIIGNNF